MNIPVFQGRASGRTRVPNITPFTYRDNLTYLEWLRAITVKVQELTEHLDDVINAVNLIRDDTETDLKNLHNTMQREWTSHGESILARVEQAVSGGVALNPTNGRVEAISDVINDVYDYAREHAPFADQLDYSSVEEALRGWVAYKHDVLGGDGHDLPVPNPGNNPPVEHPAPVISPVVIPELIVGESITPITVTVAGDLTLSVTGLPEGLNFSVLTRSITGTPATAGEGELVVTATGAGGTTSVRVPWTVGVPSVALPTVEQGVTPKTWRTGVPVEPFILASSGVDSWSFTGLPDGMTANNLTGRISGTPGIEGGGTVSVEVTNGAGSATTSFEWSVIAPVYMNSSVSGITVYLENVE